MSSSEIPGRAHDSRVLHDSFFYEEAAAKCEDRGPDRGPDRGLDPRLAILGLPDHRREEDPKAQKDRAVSVAPRDPSR
ncbi:hypothetical protein MRX96_043006 [Rhipicephalus microplus]